MHETCSKHAVCVSMSMWWVLFEPGLPLKQLGKGSGCVRLGSGMVKLTSGQALHGTWSKYISLKNSWDKLKLSYEAILCYLFIFVIE